MREINIMRQPPFQAEDKADHPPPASLCGGSTDCVWRRSTRSRDFEANPLVVLILFLCALIFALALSAIIRCFLRRRQRSHGDQPPQPFDEPSEAPRVAPVAYSLEIKSKLVGGEAECTICLSEFMEGEGIRILEECSHGFHVECIQKWLCTHSSCPTCRHSCYSSSLPSSNPTAENSHGGGPRPAITCVSSVSSNWVNFLLIALY